MTRLVTILHVLVVTFVASSAYALGPYSLRSATQAAEFCQYSEPHAPADADQETYDAARRRIAQRPVEVWVDAHAAPVIEYDRVTGSLEVGLYRTATFANGYAVATNVGTVGFELTEEHAHKLWARYEAGTAMLKLAFLPLAWSDYEKPFCRKDGSLSVVDGEVLSAALVDEVGHSIVSWETPLGREVALMRQHRIQGYLDSGTPVITVSALAPFPSRGPPLGAAAETRIKSALRAALYGCYLKGLSENGRLQGALVVKLTSHDEGATVLVDSLHDTATRGCAVERMSEIGVGPDGTTLKATVIFRLEEAPSL